MLFRMLRVPSVFVSVVAVALVTMWSGSGYAGVLTINFPGDLADPGFEVKHNSTAGGFRISPSCHYDSGLSNGLSGIGWDRAGCPPFNSEYLSHPGTFAGLSIDDNGSPFTLLSVDSLGESLLVQSSKGGVVTVPVNFPVTPGVHFEFVGPAWQDIQWVVFFYGDAGAPSGGFNQLVVLVPAPSTFVLLGLGLLTLGRRLLSSKQ